MSYLLDWEICISLTRFENSYLDSFQCVDSCCM